jgi:hypothetical protein
MEDIEEILADHQGMMETAKAEGLSEDEMVSKFGDPARLADDLQATRSDRGSEPKHEKEVYKHVTSLPVLDGGFDVEIQLVNEDLHLELHDEERIDVQGKRIKAEDYEIGLSEGTFVLKRIKKESRFSFGNSSGKFLVRIPRNNQSKRFSIKIVSGDVSLQQCHSEQLDVHTTSGDIDIRDLEVGKAMMHTVSGDLELKRGQINELHLSMVSGDTELKDLQIQGEVSCNTVSGDLDVEHTECGAFYFKTVSGDCDGKEFYPETLTVESVSGDVSIKNKEKKRDIKILKKKALSGDVNIS